MEIEQERGHPFAGGVPAEQQHVGLGPLELLEQGGDRGLRAMRLVQEGVAPHHLQAGRADRLGAEGVLVVAVQAEHVAWHVELDDLAAAVRQQPIGAHGAGQHAVDVAAGLALAENLFVAIVLHAHAQAFLHRRGRRIEDHGLVDRGGVFERRFVEGDGLHGGSPSLTLKRYALRPFVKFRSSP